MSAISPSCSTLARSVIPVSNDRRQVALVTGAAKRIGRAIALDLADAGFAIGVHYNRSRREAEDLCAAIAAKGGTAVALECNLSDADAVRALVGRCAKALGPVEVLINNASVFEPDGIGDFDDRRWNTHMALHVRAPVYLADSLAAHLPENRTGVIVNMIDQRVFNPNPTFMSYTLSKSALLTATRTLAQALAPRIRVCGIGPGPTLANTRQTPEDFAAQAGLLPLKAGPVLADICRAVRFIIDTPSLTGQMIAIDGGQHMAWQTPDILGTRE